MKQEISFKLVEQLLAGNGLEKDLFHYTSVDGLLGILDSGKIRCSHIFFMNDYEENLNAWKYYFQSTHSWKNDDPNSSRFINVLNKEFQQWEIFKSNIISLDQFNNFRLNERYIFVFSLSYVENDLSQWRSYTNGSFGYSLKFNLNNDFTTGQSIFKDSGISDISFIKCKILVRDCIYDNGEKEEIMKKLLDYTFQRFMTNHQWQNELFFNLLMLNVFFKNKKFEAEKECRITVLPSEPILFGETNAIHNMHFKKGKSFLIPYIELDITQNILKEIQIGPTPFPDHSKASVEFLLKKYRNKYGQVSVSVSKIPYRFW